MMLKLYFVLCLSCLCEIALCVRRPRLLDYASNSSSPTVDLGYSRYRPTAFNNTGRYYNFSNIRYAAPPIGDLRWRAPQDPVPETNGTQDGSIGYICPQAPTGWFAQANAALGNLSAVIEVDPSSQSESEDCLFLDVISPVGIFPSRGSKNGSNTTLAPVLINIHGGGFFIGEKRALYPPNGLLQVGNNSFVYVSINYRLGAFGFLSHLANSTSNYTSPNAGFLDQRFALAWVQRYIHLFGGDPKQVTITGESAGGMSVMAHTTAYGGRKDANLFMRGIAQSPATSFSDPQYQILGANSFLAYANVTSVDAARKLPTEVLQKANMQAQSTLPFDTLPFALSVDGDLFLDIPQTSYAKGEYVKNITMIAANNDNEARFLGNQNIQSDADFNNTIRMAFPSTPTNITDHIITDLYPPTYSDPSLYTSPQQRNNLAVKEYLISCNVVAIANAYSNKTHNYRFSVPPAIHAQDLAYTYYPTPATPDFYPLTAIALQTYLVNFVLTGNPSQSGTVNLEWPEYGSNASALIFTAEGVKTSYLDAANPRCDFWNSGVVLPAQSA